MTRRPVLGKDDPRHIFGSTGIKSIAGIAPNARDPISSGGASAISHGRRALASEDKRIRLDRRTRHPFLADWRWCYRGRRRSLRRVGDGRRKHAILDWYPPSLLFFVLGIYVLSGIDAILTVTLLNLGAAEEANPLMRWLLAEDVRLFAGVKALVTGIGLIGLTAYSHQFLFNKLRVDRVVYALFAAYSLLIIHEIQLLRLAESAGWPGS